MRKVLTQLCSLLLSIVLAYWCLVSIGNNEKYFTGFDSPTYVFGIALVTIFLSARSLLLQLARRMINPSSIFHSKLSVVLNLNNGQKPYLEAAGFFAMGLIMVIAAAPFMDQAGQLHDNQYLWLSFLLLSGVLCVGWGLLKAFLTLLRLPEDD
ncbi:hypothetical protein [Alteromonas sp. KUL49]|uniref:hypothetical protein n=1 Tax=Alteromonas sp. KUL49 TaxID=2480798 RepID=UPI00102EF5F8|nr:hypothetical protein [Alteromonas sp. KUL49]TAP40696.1 hypothetical protein EYS00_06150 [Alteromonas sp. KUL49]GEA10865.1 hypothetical protein KUL49_12400 [Alteromonas sp. KUL49]